LCPYPPASRDSDLAEEEKIKRITELFSQQIDDIREWKFKRNSHIIAEFEEIILARQKWELNDLTNICRKEDDEVQRRKDEEKEENMRKIPINIDKIETEKKKKEITKQHIQSCVQERVNLEKKQTERKKDVEEKQNEIKLSLSEEHKTLGDQVESEHDESMGKLKQHLHARIQQLMPLATVTTTTSI